MTLTLHRLLSTLVAWTVALQFFLAGAGAFGATSFHLHTVIGKALVPAALVVLGLAALARRHVRLGALFLVLVTLQFVLGKVGIENEAWLGAFHGLNALAVMAVAGNLARRSWLGAGARGA